MNTPHQGWRSRGYLPHCDAATLVQHIVFGLADAIPSGVRAPSAIHTDQLLDKAHGCCVLRQDECAEAVEVALLHADGQRYRLIAWCIMPNHMHVLAEQMEGFPLGTVVQAWKSVTAHRVNSLLVRQGRLWRREYFDRFIRDDAHLHSTIEYIESNPVSAGLAATPTNWRWSSARNR